MKQYTEEQYTRMIERAKSLRDGTIFPLNKENPLDVKIRCSSTYIGLIDAKTGEEIMSVCGPTYSATDKAWRMFVDGIVTLINYKWDSSSRIILQY